MNLRNFFFQFYWKARDLLAPGLEYSQSIYEKVLNRNVTDGCVWLDLGCGHHILPLWRFKQETELVKRPKMLVGFDYDHLSLTKHKTINLKIRGNISSLPLHDNMFDLVTSNMVFEHLKEPTKQLKEIYRILKPGGMLVFHTPNSKGYVTGLARLIPEFLKGKMIYFLENRKEEDVFPTFYKINTPADITTAAKNSGFIVKDIKLIATDAALVMIPPLVLFELLWIRLTMSRTLKKYRANLIAFLVKSGPAPTSQAGVEADRV